MVYKKGKGQIIGKTLPKIIFRRKPRIPQPLMAAAPQGRYFAQQARRNNQHPFRRTIRLPIPRLVFRGQAGFSPLAAVESGRLQE
jgi:hypothetical protein